LKLLLALSFLMPFANRARTALSAPYRKRCSANHGLEGAPLARLNRCRQACGETVSVLPAQRVNFKTTMGNRNA